MKQSSGARSIVSILDLLYYAFRRYDGNLGKHYHVLLFSSDVIKGNGKLIPQAVKLWVERYEKDPKTSMVELLAMLFEVIQSFFCRI